VQNPKPKKELVTMAVKKEITDLADKLGSSIKVQKDGTTEVSGNPYVEHLPDGLTEETVTKVQDYNTAFIAGSGLAFGKAAVASMVSNKKMEEATATFNMIGKDAVTHTVQRERETRNPKDGSTGVKLGAMTTVHEVHGSSQKVGQLGAVRTQIGQLATEKLGKA
jgi:hypothetical protein